MNSILRTGLLLFFCLSMSPAVFPATVNIQTSEMGNMYISGRDLAVTAPVAADLLAAGGRVSVEREVGADAAVAGGSVTVRAPVKQDLRVAGGNVDIEDRIGGELVAAGGKVRVRESAAVAGSAWLAGSDVSLAGKVGKDARVYANNITVSGEIDGDTHLYGQHITLAAGTKINGKLLYASPNPLSQDPSAQVRGTITREKTPGGWGRANGGRALSWFHPFFILGMLVAGVVLYMLFPNAAIGPQHAIRQQPVRSLLLGLALLFAIPPVAILFMVTVIGIPIGFALLLLYPLSLMLAYLATAFLIGRQVAAATRQPEPATLKRHALFLGLALIALSIAAAIPYLGGIVVAAAIVAGLGGWAIWIRARYSAARTS